MSRSQQAGQPWHDVVLCGDALHWLRKMPAGLVDTIVTSPPYYRQRDYGHAEQLGGESTPQQYLERLVEILAECRRVIKPAGTCWLVLGDKYINGQLQGLPWRVALALQDDGWILRSDIIWQKPNAMPSAVKNRPTTDHEYIFLLSREKNYYYDIDAIREPHVTFSKQSRMRGGRKHFFQRGSTPEQGKNGGDSNLHDARWDQAFHPRGRNRRTVWNVPLSKSRDSHFAVFPKQLVTTMISAGCPPQGLVLDPFLGSGTTALVARESGRHYLGIDCVEDYCQLARDRLAGVETTQISASSS
jgi:site-specific DNA-methyltransferase (adenine-specific)